MVGTPITVLKHEFKGIGRGMYEHWVELPTTEASALIKELGKKDFFEKVAGQVGYPENGYGQYKACIFPSLENEKTIAIVTWEGFCSCD